LILYKLTDKSKFTYKFNHIQKFTFKKIGLTVYFAFGREKIELKAKNPLLKGIQKMIQVKRGDIFYADLSPVIGSEQGGLRPVLIIQNDVGNRYSPTVIAAAITSRMGKTRMPTHIDIHAERVGLAKDSVILLEQIRTLDKKRLKEKLGHLDDGMMNSVNSAIAVSFGLSEPNHNVAVATNENGGVIA
jgi:mRNA interferase MazF